MEGDGMERNGMAGGNVENAAICGGVEGGDVTGGIIVPPATSPRPWPSYPSAPNDREIATLSQTAQQAFTKARAKAQDMGWLALDRDLSVTRAQAARMRAVPYGEPDRKAIAKLWIDAAARWSGYAADGIPQVVVDGARGVSQGPAPQSQAPRIITMLAGRGVMLTLNTEGQLLATPARMLTEADKRLVQENAIELKRILASAEIIA